MYGRKSSRLLGALLFFLSLVYGVAVRLRSRAYARGVFRKKKLPCKVISIGNITLGGTGKTPTVMHIAAFLLRKGRRPLVLSRGYGRSDESAVTVVSDGATFMLGPAEGGDEPVLISRRLPQVPVVAGSDRFRAGTSAIERFHPDAIILDDGFQHIRLARDLNIALVDGTDPFGSGRLFPAGILREPLSSLDRADVVIITRADQAAGVEQLKDAIRKNTAAAIFTARYVPRDLVNVASGAVMPLTGLRGTPVFAFAGIARPASLDAILRSLGAKVQGLAGYPDHHGYTEKDLAGLHVQAKGSGAPMLVTTEKDGVKLNGMMPEGVWALRIDLEVLEKDAWERVLSGCL